MDPTLAAEWCERAAAVLQAHGEQALASLALVAAPAVLAWAVLRALKVAGRPDADRAALLTVVGGFYLGLLLLPARSGLFWLDTVQILAALAGCVLAFRQSGVFRNLRA